MPNQSFTDGLEGRPDSGGDGYSYQQGQLEREKNERESYSKSTDGSGSSENGNAGLGFGILICIGAVANALEIIFIALISAAITAFCFAFLIKSYKQTTASYKRLILLYSIPGLINAMVLWKKINEQIAPYSFKILFTPYYEGETPIVPVKISVMLPYIIATIILSGSFIFYLNKKKEFFCGYKGYLKSVFLISPIFVLSTYLWIYLIEDLTIFSFHERIPIRLVF